MSIAPPTSSLAAALASTNATSEAAGIAAAMPLVNFPASTRFADWSQQWTGLLSPVQLGGAAGSDPLRRLHLEHVFTYAGPCCFAGDLAQNGDAAIYFHAGCERGRVGSASPFDTGAIEKGILQPMGALGLLEKQDFVEQYSVDTGAFRDHFARWLSHCYQDLWRYLDTNGDKLRDGEPDWTIPSEILERNGLRGHAAAPGTPCADRRAWTWEVRIREELSWSDVAFVHIAFDELQPALKWARVQGTTTGVRVEVESLPAHEPAGAEAFYRHSGPLLARRLKGGVQ